jgi:predicted regulator of Ras-like GTPase activity (Roadblock/LC7/MglB family)
VSIDAVLEELVSGLKDASGAIILEGDGEAIQWHAVSDGERLRLRVAYLAVVLQAFRASAKRVGLGDMSRLVLEYDDASFVVQEIALDCFAIIELKSSANIGQAMFRLDGAVDKLRLEIA